METTTLPPTVTPERPAALDEKSLNAYRRLGYLLADLDPLDRLPPATAPGLEDCDPATAEYARRYYCGTIGVEYMHIGDPARRRWIQERMESEPPAVDRDRILELLTRAETFEQFIQSRYLGTKRFSIEGVESLLPLLDEMLEGAAAHRTSQVVIAMSHRGRLNVVVHTVGREPAEIFAGFEDVDPRSILGGGDVKYHMGATGDHQGRNGHTVNIHLVSNPSHLEAVDPVALGRVRAKQVRLGDERNHDVVFPIVLHGDAAFAGQGVLAETLNMADLHGYRVGGTVHVIVNNLIGFTTEPKALHSSRFASDVARRLPIPIFHVNGEDPDAVARVARIAVDYRYAFKSDVVVDLIGFRRHGHSEVDDPTITQPLLYKKIQVHPPAWRLYAKATGVPEEEARRREEAIRARLDAAHQAASTLDRPTLRTLPDYWDRFQGGRWRPEYEVRTGLPAAEIAALTAPLTTAPAGFHVHKKIQALLQQRAEMGTGKRPIDYGMAEALAFASLVKGGVPVRLSGQDSRRGTFNQRHSVLIDVEDGSEHTPLEHVAADQACFEVYDSMLSEAAVLGFEYGYSRDFPETLVCWEAQFGDFANGAQIIIDQFVTAGEDKWGLLSGVVMLLPHGYEGQGPEHSSARLERYLQLAAEDNVTVCQPSTAAQYFHMLRRQALTSWRKPLIVMTPKSMLRHKDSASTVEDLARERFQRVVPDPDVRDAQRVLLCTGKIGHELKRERERRKDTSTAVVFLDQLYPFPSEELAVIFEQHPNARDVVWVQEEPANMGALFFVQPLIERLLHRPIRSVKRSASGSPATGSGKAHTLEQQTLLALAFTTGR
ncbi:MAG TPA: 2-oxoglutarate dehydrogenase E1 component [Thermoanaerobaculia bacterium]|jgi:2-oxoglutarate dehydrogenase E1 component|nr:2-oxoglutarate dehydrogenase E1 component [Thermoanaerobaculia bacterium]